MAKTKWVVVSDNEIRHIWRCGRGGRDVCDGTTTTAQIDPRWYQDNGTPVCECGRDMVYVRTEVRKQI